MKLSFFTLKKKSLELTQPLQLGQEKISTRETLFLAFQDRDGDLHWGEAAPLVSVHPETMSEAYQALHEFSKRCPTITLDTSKIVWTKPAFGLIDEEVLPSESSALTAIEQLLWSCLWKEEKLPINLDRHSKFINKKIALLHLASENLSENLKELQSQGYECAKIKVGRRPFEDELKALKAIEALLEGSNFSLRIDANCSLTCDQLKQFEKDLTSLPIQFVEEPFQDPQDWKKRSSRWPLARDESLWGDSAEIKERLSDCKYLVLKPMRLTLSGSLRLIEQAQHIPRENIILSACYESGLSLLYFCHIARVFSLTATHGFGTYDYLAEDIFKTRLFEKAGSQEVRLDRTFWMSQLCLN